VTYTTGRRVAPADYGEIEQIIRQSNAKGAGLRTLVLAVVTSEMFRSR
jgi:hypothetical protein